MTKLDIAILSEDQDNMEAYLANVKYIDFITDIKSLIVQAQDDARKECVFFNN
jgi:hypothetical protein